MKLMFLVRRKVNSEGGGGRCGCKVEMNENRKVIQDCDVVGERFL